MIHPNQARLSLLRWAVCVTALLTLGTPASAGDWPTHRHDAQRSAATDEQPSFPLRAAWVYRCAQAPRPAWPETYHHLNRLDFDYAPHPITGGGMVFFGSTADDAVRALDEKTGEPRWSFVTGGPVRFPPQFVAGRLYVGSDDGFVYALDAATGKLLWKYYAAPYDDMLVGNGRMISRWPVRTGVLVSDNTVYLAAGMWNADGIHLCALNAETGAVVWRNDNAGFMSVFMKGTQTNRTEPVTELVKNAGHEGEFAATGLTPQGALLVWGDNLIVPTGTSFPWRFNRLTGESKPWNNRVAPAPSVGGAAGGTWNCIDKGVLYTHTKYRTDVTAMTSINVETGGHGRGVLLTLPNFNTQPSGVGSRYRPDDFIHDKGKASVVVSRGKGYTRAAYSLAMAGTTLLVGLDGEVVAREAETDREMWRVPGEGIAREIAIANGRVIVSTDRGVVYSFASDAADAPKVHDPVAGLRSHPTAGLPTPAAAKVIDQLRAGGMDCGFALVLGDPDARLAQSLAESRKLHVISVQPSDAEAGVIRDRLIATTALYGTRLHVLPLGRAGQLPFARYFANAVIVAGPTGVSGREAYRVLRPYGGMLITPGLTAVQAAALLKETGATAEERARISQGVVRGAIVGARDWDNLGADTAIAGPMRVLWFGGPETELTQSLRQSKNAPTAVNGRYLTMAENRLSAVDAYNGTVQWTQMIPRQNRDLRDIDSVVYVTTENASAGAATTTAATQTAEPESAAEKKQGKEKSKSANAAHPVDDAEMVSMDESAETGVGRSLRVVDAQTGYLVLGKPPGDMWVEFDFRAGTQKRIYSRWTPPAVVSLLTAQAWTIPLNAGHSGAVNLAADAEGLLVTLTTLDPAASKLDAWDLFFDLRPLDRRAGLYERGTFHLMITPAGTPGGAPAYLCRNGPAHPAVQLAGERSVTGTKTTVRLSWAELDKITGARATSFGFAVTLNSHDGGKDEPILRRHLFGNWVSDALNHGWANVFVGPVPASVEPPALVAAIPADMPKKYPDQARMEKASPPMLNAEVARAPRVHPLTGELEPKIYRSGGGMCGSPGFSSTVRFGRTVGSLGLYDFADDSGLRNLSGIKAGCSTAITPALGLVIISPEGGHCICTFPFATTVTLAPGDRRPNEDWAIYHDRPADTLVRQATINLGAFGDRRDGLGTLWLGFPRSPERAMNFSRDAATYTATAPAGLWLRYAPAAMQVPLAIECFDPENSHKPEEDLINFGVMWFVWTPNRLNKTLGPYRVNTDAVPITNTDRPWLYGSGYRGIKKATLRLDFRTPLVAEATSSTPRIDGKRDDAWGKNPTHVLPSTRTQVFLRHDADHLYIAMQRPAVANRLGEIAPWNKTTTGEDAQVWNDDSCEVFLSDGSEKVMHLGVSASGARFDALASETQQNEDAAWNGKWSSATTGDESTLTFELAIPFSTLTDAGLRKDRMAINVQMNQKDVSGEVFMFPAGLGRETKPRETSGEAVSFLGAQGRAHCRNFVPLGLGVAPSIPERSFTLRLHFAELEGAAPGQRVFDVKVQGDVAIKALDIVKEAGPRVALVKEIPHVKASDELMIEFVPKDDKPTPLSAPVVSALELFEEGFVPPLPAKKYAATPPR